MKCFHEVKTKVYASVSRNQKEKERKALKNQAFHVHSLQQKLVPGTGSKKFDLKGWNKKRFDEV